MELQKLGSCPLLVVPWKEESLYFCLKICPSGPGQRRGGCSRSEWQCGGKDCVGRHALVKVDLSPPTSFRTCEPRVDSGCDCCVIGPLHCDLNPDLKFAPPFVELGRRTIKRVGICNHLLVHCESKCGFG